ncbi:MAG TPA: SH3 domain-containing protein [Fastidiosipila sp.]|nr:SH3 domain-containing protein [Fastidiosipila sp.]
MDNSYRIVEPDDYYPSAPRRINPIRRFFRKLSGGSQVSLRRKLIMLGAPIIASLLVVSVFATQILIDNKAKTDIVFERPEFDSLNEHEYNRGLDNPLSALAAVEEETEESEIETETEPTEEETETETEAVTEAITEAATEPAFVEYDRYVNTTANLRFGPSTETDIEATLAPNTKVTVMGVSGDWSLVRLAAGQNGYIRSDLLSRAPVEVEAAPAETPAATPEPTRAEAQTEAPTRAETQSQTERQTERETTRPTMSGTMYVRPDYAYIRSGPGQENNDIGFAMKGDKVTVVNDFEEWAQIRTQTGLTGFIFKELLSSTPIEGRAESFLQVDRSVYVTVSYAYLRSGPSTDSSVVGGAERNELLTQTETDGSWSKVKTTDGVTGYIRNDLLTRETPENVIRKTQATTAAPTTAAPTATTPPTNAGSNFQNVNRTVYVNTAAANIRRDATTDSARVTTVYYGTELTQVSTNGSWSKVTTSNGTTGYMLNSLFTTEAPAATTAPTTSPTTAPTSTESSWAARDRYVWVFVASANLRSDASTNASIVTSVSRGTKLKQTASNGTWSKVTTEGGTNAYILNTLFQLEEISAPEPTTAPTSPPDSGNASKRQQVVNAAMAQVGKPYVFGSASPSVGFDCSGLVMYAYNQAGYGIRYHSATQQGRRYGTTVSYSPGNYSTLLPGDLLFFGSGSTYTHVGIYVGNGQMVHAPRPGYNVTTVHMSNYWRPPVIVKRLYP